MTSSHQNYFSVIPLQRPGQYRKWGCRIRINKNNSSPLWQIDCKHRSLTMLLTSFQFESDFPFRSELLKSYLKYDKSVVLCHSIDCLRSEKWKCVIIWIQDMEYIASYTVRTRRPYECAVLTHSITHSHACCFAYLYVYLQTKLKSWRHPNFPPNVTNLLA